MRGSLGATKSTSGIMQRDASTADEPKYCVKAPLLLVPAVAHDRPVDAVPLLAPAIAVAGNDRLRASRTPRSSATQHCNFEYTKCCRPPRTSQMPRSSSSPVLAHPVEQPLDRAPHVVRERRAVLVVQIDRVHQLAVDVELQVLAGGVADAHRPRAAVAVEVVELDLGELVTAVDAVHHVERAVFRLLLLRRAPA